MAGFQTFADQGLGAGGLQGGRVGGQIMAERLAHQVQLGEVVAAGLDVVAHPVGGAGGLGGRGGGTTLRQGAVQAHHRVGGAGQVLGQLQDLVARDGDALEQGVGEDLGQGRLAAGPGLAAEGPQVHVIGLGQPQQELRRDGPLVALDMVQIAGRDPQIRGHGGLGQGELAPQPLEASAQKQFAVGVVAHSVMMS